MSSETMVYNRKKYPFFIAQATFEYFISILITTTYLTNVLNEVGVSDALSGIISSFAIFCQMAQMLSVSLGRTKNHFKSVFIILRRINELAFALLYIVPFFDISANAKTTLLIGLLLCGQVIMNYTAPALQNWMGSSIDPKERGCFTAKKEMISLLSGMIFTVVMGRMVDYFEAKGDMKSAFYIISAVIIGLSLLHMASTLAFPKPQKEIMPSGSVIKAYKEIIKNKAFRRLIVVDILWQIAASITSFNGVYQRNTLGFSMTFISIITMVSSLSRAAISLPFGKLADKIGWARMLNIAFLVSGSGYVFLAITNTSNGSVFYTVYSVLYAVSMAGINGGLVNITFNYIAPSERTTAIGLKFALGGLSGFLISLVYGAIVAAVQGVDNVIFGITVYPQQLLGIIGFAICLILVIYIKKVIQRLEIRNL